MSKALIGVSHDYVTYSIDMWNASALDWLHEKSVCRSAVTFTRVKVHRMTSKIVHPNPTGTSRSSVVWSRRNCNTYALMLLFISECLLW